MNVIELASRRLCATSAKPRPKQAVTSTVAGVAQASQETGVTANLVPSAAPELSRQFAHLTAEVVRFLDTVRAA